MPPLAALIAITASVVVSGAIPADHVGGCGAAVAAESRTLHDLSKTTPAERTLLPGREALESRFTVQTTVGLSGNRFTSRLRAVIRLNSGSASQDATASTSVQLAVNGRVSNLIDLTRQDGRIVYTYTGLLTGAQQGDAAAPELSIDFENYAQTKAVTAGANVLSVSMSADGGGLVESIVLEPESGVGYTSADPKQLNITTPGSLRVPVGETFDIPFQLSRRCERPDKPATISVKAFHDSAVLEPAAPSITYSGVANGRNGVLHARIDAAGTFYLQLTMRGGYNDQTRLITVQAEDPPTQANLKTRIPIAVLLLAVAALLFILRARRASRPLPQRGDTPRHHS